MLSLLEKLFTGVFLFFKCSTSAFPHQSLHAPSSYPYLEKFLKSRKAAFQKLLGQISRIYANNDSVRFLLYWVAIIATCLITFVIFALHMTVQPSQFQAPVVIPQDPFSPDVDLTAEIISVDPISRTITMNWYPVLVNQNCASNVSSIVNIFLPTTLQDSSSPFWSSDPNDMPVSQLNSTQICFARTQTYISFRTVTKLVASKEYLLAQETGTQATFQSYPFDVYIAPFSFYTQDVQTGVIKALRVSQSFGIAVNFEISLINSFVAYTYNQNLQFYLRIERSTATKAFVVIVAITNWITAIAFLTILASTIVYRSHEIYAEMFVVPIGAVFAFSSVRSNLPGAPAGFGATIDLYTILPVLVIMSFCSVTLLLTVLYRRIHQDNERLSRQANESLV